MNIQKIMKQAQEMQTRMAAMQEKLAAEQMEATAGGGMIKAVVNGKHEVISLKIDPKCVDPNDVEMLEDLVLTAINEAQRRVEEHMQKELQKVTGGMQIPGLF